MLVLAALLGAASLPLDPHTQGWFDNPHDRALLWKDIAGAVAVICLPPAMLAVYRKRSTLASIEAAVMLLAGLALAALIPASGLAQ